MSYIYFEKIANENIIIREIDSRDKDDLFELFSDELVCEYLSFYPYKSVDEINELIEKIKINYKNKQIYYLGIEFECKLVGHIGLSRFDLTAETCQIVYSLNSKYWRKGIMTKAVKLFVDYLINKENKKIIIGTHIDKNPNSGMVMLKAGFSRDPNYDQKMVIKNIEESLIGYSIKKE